MLSVLRFFFFEVPGRHTGFWDGKISTKVTELAANLLPVDEMALDELALEELAFEELAHFRCLLMFGTKYAFLSICVPLVFAGADS